MIRKQFPETNVIYVSTVTAVSIQNIIIAMLPRLISEVFCITITDRTCNFFVVKAVSKSEVYHPAE